MVAQLMESQGERKANLLNYVMANGLPPLVDGPRLEHYDGKALAAAIKSEIVRAELNGQTKIVLTMELVDAFRLAEKLDSCP